jgi:hypothetical protein
MHKIKLGFLLTLLLLAPASLLAQNSTNSPYARYGYGKLADQSFGAQRAMGGIGIGLRNGQMINALNPASFSSVDSMTFMFDLGVTGHAAWYDDGTNKSNKINGNIDYMAMQFPLAKRLGMGIGLAPMSYKGYKYGDVRSLSVESEMAQETLTGSGGLSKVYGTLSYSFFDRLALGVKVGYLFGDLNDTKTVTYNTTTHSSIQWADTLRVSAWTIEAGLQYHQPIGKNKELVIGVVYSPRMEISEAVRKGEHVYSSPSRSEHSVSRDSIFELPQTIGVGLSFSKKNHYTVGADFQLQQWGDARFYNKTDSLSDNMRISLGGEYIPDYQAHSFFKRIRYRAGAYYSDSYINVGGNQYKEYGATLGFGLPINDRRSFLNLAFDFTMIKPDVSSIGMIDEKYFKITLSYTFNELWFFKRKIY